MKLSLVNSFRIIMATMLKLIGVNPVEKMQLTLDFVLSIINLAKGYGTKSEAFAGYQLRWLERTPDKGEVPGSSPGWPTKKPLRNEWFFYCYFI